MKNERKIILFNINVNRPIYIQQDEMFKMETNNNLFIHGSVDTTNGFSIKTDLRNRKELIHQPRKKDDQSILSFNQASQVHEYVIQHILSHHKKVRGINFIVRDKLRSIVEIQIQITRWDRILRKRKWKRICSDLSKFISTRMPVGMCTIKPI